MTTVVSANGICREGDPILIQEVKGHSGRKGIYSAVNSKSRITDAEWDARGRQREVRTVTARNLMSIIIGAVKSEEK